MDESRQYGKYKGSLSSVANVIGHLRDPRRYIQYLRYHPTFKLFTKGEKPSSWVGEILQADVRLKQALVDLNENGVAIIDQYFDNKTCDLLEELFELAEYKKEMDKVDPTNTPPPLTQNFLDIWCDKGLCAVMQSHSGRFMYARDYPHFFYVNPLLNQMPTRKYSKDNTDFQYLLHWHYDHLHLIQISILLHDIGEEDTHMMALGGRGARLFSPFPLGKDYDLSDETVNEEKQNIIRCIGKRGTVYFHNGNVMHRAHWVKGSARKLIKLAYCPGTNILFNCNQVSALLKDDFDIEKIPSFQRQLLSSIFPICTGKGFELSNNSFKNMGYKGR